MHRADIIQKYISQLLEEGKVPVSVYAFCKKAEIDEQDFYGHFSSLEHIRDSILAELATDTFDRLRDSEAFRSYSFREQVLAYFFTISESLLAQRSYLLMEFGQFREPAQQLKNFREFRKSFMKVAEQLISEGVRSGAIKDLKFQRQVQQEALWVNLVAVFGFWMRDRSSNFEDTDAMIEKSLHLTLDLLEQNTLNKAMDLGRFLFGKVVS